MAFKDHFSGHADEYEAFRPTYPDALFAYLGTIAPSHERAWDCATGNGQSAVALAAIFEQVIATDASKTQIAQAQPHSRVRYLVAPAEKVPIPDRSVDLVTISQALHWFDLVRFYAEVRRVVRPGGLIAAWCYELHAISTEVDAVVHRFYREILDGYWPPERRIVEDGYRTLWFPFAEIAPPAFPMTERWDLAHLLGYLGTWSSVRLYRTRNGRDPRDLIVDELAAAWGDPRQVRDVVWPLNLRVGTVADADSSNHHD